MVSATDSGLVFAAIMPHGYMAIPEACGPEDGALGAATQAAMAEIGHRCAAAQPDAVIVVTPHNVHVEGHFAVIVAGRLAGDLSRWTAQPIELTAHVDLELTRALLSGIELAGLPAVGVSYGGNAAASATAPMDWATLIPLWFTGGRSTPPVPVVVVAPARDLPASDHVRLGQVLAEVAARSGKRVALVASADQAHTHREGPPYGYDPAAASYDARVLELLRAQQLDRIIGIDPALTEAAKADSYWQMLVLAGSLGDQWTGEVLSYEVPTYFGMLCAAYRPRDTEAPHVR